MKDGLINAMQQNRTQATIALNMYHNKAYSLNQMIWILMTVFLASLSNISHAAYHPIYGKFDIPIEAANNILATAYYSGQFPTNLSGSLDTNGAIQVNLNIQQPSLEDLNLVEGALYVDILLPVNATYTIVDRSYTFNQKVAVRLGLKQGTSLKFAQAPIQFLDESIPRVIRDLLNDNLQERLLANSNFIVSLQNIIAALPTTTKAYTHNHIEYEVSISRPFLETIPVLVKPIAGNFRKPAVVYRLHIPTHVAIQFDGKHHSYDLDITPQGNFCSSCELDMKYTLTDEQFDIVITNIQNYITDLPAVIRQQLESTLIGRAFTLYKGHIIDLANASIPDDVDIIFSQQTLFTLPLSYLEDLQQGYRVEIDQAFATQGYPLSGSAVLTVVEQDNHWYINDGDTGLYELVKQANGIRVQVPAAAVDVEFNAQYIRFTLRANVLSTPPSFTIDASAIDAGSIRVSGNVSGRVEHMDISTISGSQVKDFGAANLTSSSFGWRRTVIWNFTDNSGKPVARNTRYLIRVVVNTGHKLYTATKQVIIY